MASNSLSRKQETLFRRAFFDRFGLQTAARGSRDQQRSERERAAAAHAADGTDERSHGDG